MAVKKNSGANSTKKVTTVAEASATKLAKATDGLAKIFAELQGTNDEYEGLVTNIQLKQAEMESLETEFSEKEREIESEGKRNLIS